MASSTYACNTLILEQVELPITVERGGFGFGFVVFIVELIVALAVVFVVVLFEVMFVLVVLFATVLLVV